MQIGLSNKFVETAKVSIRPNDLAANLELAKSLVSKINAGAFSEERTQWGRLIRGVPVEYVDEFLAGWRNEDRSVTTEPRPIRSYIRARKSDQLKTWDVLIPSLEKGISEDILGTSIVPANRSVDLHDLKYEFMSFSGKKMRVASRGIEKAGVDASKAQAAEARYRAKEGKSEVERVNYPDSIYRKERDLGLFILHFVKGRAPKGEETKKEAALIPSDPVVAWGISLPESNYEDDGEEFIVNTVKLRELFGEEDEDDDQEAALEAS
jgi:hypothetical protein